MFRPGAELPEAWLDKPILPLDEAIAAVRDPRSTQEALMRVAAGAFEVPESDETLWDPSHSQYLTVGEDDDDELELLGTWRYIGGDRRAELLRYVDALRELEDLDYIADRERMELEAATRDTSHAAAAPAPGFLRSELDAAGFAGFVSVGSLRDGCQQVPESPGVYLVLRDADKPATFLERSVGGAFKGRDPSLETLRLKNEWVDQAAVLYIGSAGNLRRRVDQLVRFGRGEPIGHWGDERYGSLPITATWWWLGTITATWWWLGSQQRIQWVTRPRSSPRSTSVTGACRSRTSGR